jgi:CRISPR-associated exonuclease Cas4
MITQVTGTFVSYYHYCKRRLWLFANQIRMEDASDIVREGKLIGENTYTQRSDKYTEIAIENIKVDFYDAKEKVIHETKRSDSFDNCDEAQVKFYIRVLERNGIEGVTGILEYPKIKHISKVEITDKDRAEIEKWEKDILQIINNQLVPQKISDKKCKKCAYFDFCYAS